MTHQPKENSDQLQPTYEFMIPDETQGIEFILQQLSKAQSEGAMIVNNKNEGMYPGKAAKTILASANIIENYLMGIQRETKSNDVPMLTINEVESRLATITSRGSFRSAVAQAIVNSQKNNQDGGFSDYTLHRIKWPKRATAKVEQLEGADPTTAEEIANYLRKRTAEVIEVNTDSAEPLEGANPTTNEEVVSYLQKKTAEARETSHNSREGLPVKLRNFNSNTLLRSVDSDNE